MVAIIIIAFLASIFTVFGGLEFIASFSSMTFLFVSIAVNIANIRLYKATKSKIFPIILGLVFMGITVILLIIYMAHNIPWTLLIIACIYATTGVAHMLFERLRTRKKVR